MVKYLLGEKKNNTFSIAASSGITTWHVQPNAGATVARLIAVLPALPSVTTPPSTRCPFSIAYPEKHYLCIIVFARFKEKLQGVVPNSSETESNKKGLNG
jgi:hypothetical protein